MVDERTLLEKLARGDRASFDALYMRYAAKTEEFLCRMIKNRAEAEDITHDLFLKIWQNRSSMAGVTAFGSYLFRMARNAVLDICKHSRIRMQFESSARVDGQILCDDVAERVDTAELSRLIAAAVSKMPARRYEIFRLSRECGKNNREIAEELNISPKSVENQITKALGSIKKEIS